MFLTFKTIIFVILSTAATDNTQSLTTSNDIDQFLDSTENIRTKDHNQFRRNLDLLHSSQSSFNQFQKCMYDFLVIYADIYIGKKEGAESKLLALFNQCENLNIKIRVKAMLANHYFVEKDYYNSILNLNYINSQLDNVLDKKTKHLGYTVSFLVYKSLKQNELSLKFVDLLLNDNTSDDLLCKARVTKYSILSTIQHYSEIEDEINSSIEQCEIIHELVFSNILKLYYIENKLKNYKDKSEIQQIIAQLIDANKEIEQTRYKNIIGLKNGLFAKAYFEIGDTQKAIEYSNLTIKGEALTGRKNYRPDAYKILMQYEIDNENFKQAFEYLKQIRQLELNSNEDYQDQIIAYSLVTHENLANSHKIKFLNQQNEVLKLQNNLAKETQLNQKLFILILVLGVGLLTLWGYKNRKEQKIYRKLSELDHMTLIYNRKGMRDYMKYLLPYSEKKSELVSYAIFDLDHFKNINDQYGHVTGDWVIKNVILECQKVRNDNEKITYGRLGGEEFAIIIRDSCLQEIQDFAEACRYQIEQINSSDAGYDIPIRASFGVTTTEKSGYVYTDLMSDADKALYQAKDSGRNKVVVFKG